MKNLKQDVMDYVKHKYKVQPRFPFARNKEACAFYNKDNKKWFGIIMRVSKKKLGLCGEEEIEILNVKADSDFIAFFANKEGYCFAYHMNKKNWITLRLDGSLGFDEIRLRLDESFVLVDDSASKRIYEAVKKIPYGKVATYKQIAALAGNEKMSRAVGNALHKNPDSESIPCYRVVNAKGELSKEFAFGGSEEQAKKLRDEGVEVIEDKVDLKKFQMKSEEV